MLAYEQLSMLSLITRIIQH